MRRLYQILLPGIFPFSICMFLLIFIIVYRILNLPSPERLSEIIINWFSIYGFKLLFVAALIEGVFILGMYFPGSLAIALAVYSLGNTIQHLFFIGLISFVAFFIANIFNYFLGKYGYYKILLLIGKNSSIDKMHNTMAKYGLWTFVLTGFFPNFIAITSVCAGISKLNLTKTIFFQGISLLFWVTLWTIIGSLIINHIDIKDNNQSIYILILIFIWGVYLVIKEQLKKNKIKNQG